jgi:hypothetical protein
MSFIATEPTEPSTMPATPAPGTSTNASVQNDGWFPDIDLLHVRQAQRLDGTVTDARLRDAVIGAVIDVNTRLHAWRAAHEASGITRFAAVPAPEIGGESVKLALYRSAVGRLAKADLTERYRDYDSTKSGAAHAAQLETTTDDDRRAAHWAISDIAGRPRTTVELI